MKKHRSKIVGGIIFISLLFSIYFHVIVEDTYTVEHVASGIVQQKQEYTYGCGRHGNSTCYQYAVTIDGKKHNINPSSFNGVVIGENIKLINTRKEYKWFPLMVVTSGISILFFGYLLLCCFLALCWWLTSDENDKFKDSVFNGFSIFKG